MLHQASSHDSLREERMEERLHTFYTSVLMQKTDLIHVTAVLPPRENPVLYTEQKFRWALHPV